MPALKRISPAADDVRTDRAADRTLAAPPAARADARAPVDPAMAEEVARYIGLMTGEMVGMARGARLELLAYFLDMARIEANVAMRRAPQATPRDA